MHRDVRCLGCNEWFRWHKESRFECPECGCRSFIAGKGVAQAEQADQADQGKQLEMFDANGKHLVPANRPRKKKGEKR